MKYLTGEMVLPPKEEMYELLKADQKMRQEKLGKSSQAPFNDFLLYLWPVLIFFKGLDLGMLTNLVACKNRTTMI